MRNEQHSVRVAATSWGVRAIATQTEFIEHIRDLVSSAVQRGAELVVLPELFQVELLALHGNGAEQQVAPLLAPYADLIDDTLSSLAREHSITIVGGSYLRRDGNRILNYAATARPDGKLYFQPKNCRTQWEISPWGLAATTGIRDVGIRRLGVLVCYDVEFPEAVRAQAERGVELLCVPSYTESQHGYQRVNWCCRARSIENELFVAQSCLVGPIERFGLGTGYGRCGIYAPSKTPFPDSASLAEGELNIEGVCVAVCDFDTLATCRNSGDARPWSDRKLSSWNLLPS